jgi:hypothetical protein
MENTKLFSVIGILAVLFLSLSLVSAASTVLTLSAVSAPSSVNEDAGSFDVTFNVTYTGATPDKNITFEDSTTNLGSISIPSVVLNGSINETKTVTATVSGFANEGGKTLTGIINATGFTEDTLSFSVPIAEVLADSFCAEGAVNDSLLELKIDISNLDGDDEEWLPLDRIEIKVEIENNWDEDLNDVVFELGLFKEGSTTNIADDMIWESEDEEEFEIGDVDEDEDGKHTFEFTVDPEVDSDDYLLKIKAYPDKGEDDEACIDYSEDMSDSEFGSSEQYAEITIDREDSNDDRAVIVDVDSLVTPIPATCGGRVTIIADIYNIGDEDQEQTKIRLYNSELGMDLTHVIREDLDQGDKEAITFTFDVPSDAEEKTHKLIFWTEYDYNDNKDLFREISENFPAYLKVEGSCGVAAEPTISPTPLSETPVVGEEFIVKTTITNNGNSADNFVVSATGYESWAELVSISPQLTYLEKGDSADVTITLKPTTEGTQAFKIQTIVSGVTTEQPVSVSITEKVKTGFFTGAFAGASTTTYLVTAIVIVLILIIITLIVKLSNAPRAAEF